MTTTLSPANAERLKQAFLQCRDMEGSLREQLEAYAAAGREIFPAYGEAVDRLVARLNENGGGENAPRPGEVMPPFLLPDSGGRLVGLAELLARGPVAVVFHRGHWCPYCRINTNALARAHREIQEAGGQIVAIMPDREQFTAKLQSAAATPFPILTDVDNGYALSLNLAIWVGAEMERMMAAAGVDLPTYQGNDSWILPIPATFVVGADGRIRARFVDPDYRRRMAIEDMLKALRAAR